MNINRISFAQSAASENTETHLAVPVGAIVSVEQLREKYDYYVIRVLEDFLEQSQGKSQFGQYFKIIRELPNPEEYGRLLRAKFQSTLGKTITHAYTELETLMANLVERFHALPPNVQSSNQADDFLFLLESLEKSLDFPIQVLIFDPATETKALCFSAPNGAYLTDRFYAVIDTFWYVAVQARKWSEHSKCSKEEQEHWHFCWRLLGGISMTLNDLVADLNHMESCWN